MTNPDRRYLARLGLAFAAYGLLLTAAIVLARRTAPGSPEALAAMLLPVPALLGIVWAVGRYLRDADDFLNRSTLESIAVGFAGGSVTTFTWGLLETVGAPHLSWLFVWPVYAVWWILGSVLVRRHYR